MKAVSVLVIFAACLTTACAQSPAYDQPHRPQFHFSPAENWMNDPNGLVHHEGEYHLFYQYNPYGAQWGHMSWGHAVSPDLVHWEELPVALEEEAGVMIFSGSAVVDHDNASGFGTDDRPPMVAIYTGHREGRQDQRIAYSNDRGRTWHRYDDNPVLDLGRADFRDPKVFRYDEDDRWIMSVALPTEHKVQFYASADLKDWTFLSEFGPAGSIDGIWECPDLFPLSVDGSGERRWVLEVDLGDDGGPRGSSAQYFVGQFDGTTFTAEDPDSVRWVDHGADYYAAVSWNDVPDGRRIWLGWMSNWRYAGDLPTSPWRGSQSLPRTVELERRGGDIHLVQKPVIELATLRGPSISVEGVALADEEAELEDVSGTLLEIVAEIDVGTAEEAGLKVRVGDGEETVIGIDRRASTVFVDRRRSGAAEVHPDFPARHEGPVHLANGRIRLHLFVDRSSVEVFAGETVITDRIFPSLESDAVYVYAKGGSARVLQLEAWPLESIWKHP